MDLHSASAQQTTVLVGWLWAQQSLTRVNLSTVCILLKARDETQEIEKSFCCWHYGSFHIYSVLHSKLWKKWPTLKQWIMVVQGHNNWHQSKAYVRLAITCVADWRPFAFTGKLFVSPARNTSRDFVFRRLVSSSGRYISFHGYRTFGSSAADSVSHGRAVDSTGRKAIGQTVTKCKSFVSGWFSSSKTNGSAVLNSCGSDLGWPSDSGFPLVLSPGNRWTRWFRLESAKSHYPFVTKGLDSTTS